MRDSMDSGTQFALQAIQGQIEAYTSGVRDQFDSIRVTMEKFDKRFETHAEKEAEWQQKIEINLAKALSYGERVEKLEKQVGEHHRIFQASVGVMWASKVLWLLVGVIVSALAWGYTHFKDDIRIGSANASVTHQPLPPVPSPTPAPASPTSTP